MATISTIVRDLEAQGIKPGSSCYFKELQKATLSYYNMSEDNLSDETASKLKSFFKKMASKLKDLYVTAGSKCEDMLSRQKDTVRHFSTHLI